MESIKITKSVDNSGLRFKAYIYDDSSSSPSSNHQAFKN